MVLSLQTIFTITPIITLVASCLSAIAMAITYARFYKTSGCIEWTSSISIISCIISFSISIDLSYSIETNASGACYLFFFGLYRAFTYVPMLIALLGLEKKQPQPSLLRKAIIYLGFLIALAIVICGIILSTVVWSIEETEVLVNIRTYAASLYLNLIATGVCLLLCLIYFPRLPKGSTRYTLLGYIIVLVLSKILNTIPNEVYVGLTASVVMDVFSGLLSITAILLVFFKGHCWRDAVKYEDDGRKPPNYNELA